MSVVVHEITAMLVNIILYVSLLVATWEASSAFRPCASPLQKQRSQPRIRIQRLQQQKSSQSKQRPPTATCRTHISACRGGAISPLVATTTVNGEFPQQHQSSDEFARAETAAVGDRKRALQGTRQTCTETKKSGANLLTGASLTRSQALASTVLLAFATGPWGPTALAEDTTGGSPSDTARPPGEPAVRGAEGEVQVAGSAAVVQPPKYVVGSDEVGVLFGDGPIGVKLGDNPLKASGVCRVYITEVGTAVLVQLSVAGFHIIGRKRFRGRPTSIVLCFTFTGGFMQLAYNLLHRIAYVEAFDLHRVTRILHVDLHDVQ